MKAAYRSAMATLYAEQKTWVERVVCRAGVPSRDVEDVTHDAFVQIGRALPRLDPGRPLRPWLATIARRVARDHLALRRTGETPREIMASGLTDATPEAVAIDAEQRAYVRHVVGQGDAILARVIFGEETWAQIAADLGVPVSTVQARVRRAYAVLWARLRRRRASPSR